MKIGRFFLAISSVAFALVATASAAAPAPEGVRLLRAQSIVAQRYGFVTQSTQYDVVTGIFDHDKSVTVHVEGSDGSSADYPATFVRAVDATHELWHASHDYKSGAWSSSGETTIEAPRALSIDVRVDANGATVRDDNGGRRYALGSSDGPLLATTNALVNYWSLDSALSVGVDVRNLAYAKDVTIVYSPDGWRTVKTAKASFTPDYSYGYAWVPSPNAVGVERWSLRIPADFDCVDFAVSYSVAGTTYWDDNFGQNYRGCRR
jgi:hypothetical protein